nr:MAG TPA: hypothetical protein [Caudoviricetes sp.]
MVSECKSFRPWVDADCAMLPGVDNGRINAAFVVRNVDSPVLLPLFGNEYRGEQPAPDDDLLLDSEREPVAFHRFHDAGQNIHAVGETFVIASVIQLSNSGGVANNPVSRYPDAG